MGKQGAAKTKALNEKEDAAKKRKELAYGLMQESADHLTDQLTAPIALPDYSAIANQSIVSSDENSKQEIESLRAQVAQLRGGGGQRTPESPQTNFRDVNNYAYRYKDPNQPGAAPGVQIGTMAHEIERVLPNVVQETPAGKMVDAPRLTLALPGAIGEQQERTDNLERQFAELEQMVRKDDAKKRTARSGKKARSPIDTRFDELEAELNRLGH
jgi:hypothetical protein